MNYRKIISILAVGTISLGTVLTGCGGGGSAPAEDTSAQTAAPEETTLAPEIETESETKEKKNYAAEYPVISPVDLIQSVKDNVEPAAFTVEEQVILDQDGYKITILPNRNSGSDGMYHLGELPLISCENNTDEDIYVQIENLAINNRAISDHTLGKYSYLNRDIGAGEEAVIQSGDDMSEFLLEQGISEVKYIDANFRICKADARETILTTDRIRIETSLMNEESDLFLSKETMIYDDDDNLGILIYAAYQIEENGDLVITAMLDNRTDTKLNLQLNGFNEDIGKYFSCDYNLTQCPPGTYGFTTFRFAADSFSENAPEEYLYMFDVYGSDSYDVVAEYTIALAQ